MRKITSITLCLCLILPAMALAQMNRFNTGLDLTEISAPSGNPEANHLWVYVKDAGSTSTLYFENDAGVASALTSLAPTTDLVWEGSTADAYEATIRATDPTADTIFIMPVMAAGSYAFAVSTLATNGVDIANSVWGGTSQLIFEGSSADAHEAVITATNPTADTIWTLPVAAAGTYSLMSSTLATNALDVANSVTGASNALVFEGTADAHEVTLTASDATGDVTVTIPARTGTVTLDTKTVNNKADEDSPVTATCGAVWTNASADGACVFNLPEASTVIGQSITFAVAAAQNLDINPDNADQIILATNGAGDAIRCATAGSTVTLTAISAVNWVQTGLVGTWSDVN